MAVEVLVTDEFREWYGLLTEAAQQSIRRVIGMLETAGTALGHPQSSAIKGSAIALRELRVQHMGEPYRILYVFDPARQAILLVGGNKSGKGKRWYESAVRLAERLYREYLDEIGALPRHSKGD